MKTSLFSKLAEPHFPPPHKIHLPSTCRFTPIYAYSSAMLESSF